jgi:hypothetical protein
MIQLTIVILLFALSRLFSPRGLSALLRIGLSTFHARSFSHFQIFLTVPHCNGSSTKSEDVGCGKDQTPPERTRATGSSNFPLLYAKATVTHREQYGSWRLHRAMFI